MSPIPAGSDSSAANEPTWFGHPRGLSILFFAELWERFCYYGMRALLALYVVSEFAKPQAEASKGYGAFTALVYALGIFGGAVADRVLGYRRSIILGAIAMAIGEFMLMMPDERSFLAGLAVMVVGNGLFKPNISTMVGKLYKPGDPRRDGGFTIFYMGINIGATLAPLACQWVSAEFGSYRYGFMLAGAGMLLGTFVFALGGKLLKGEGLPPKGREGIGPIIQVVLGVIVVVPLMYFLLGKGEWLGYILFSFGGAILLYILGIALKSEAVVRDRLTALLILLLCNVAFWMAFEQSGNSLNFFAQQHVDALTLGGWTMPFEWFQSVNAVFIVLLGPVFAALWVKLDRKGLNPSIPRKFGFGLIQVGLGFLVLLLAIKAAGPAGLVGWYMLMLLYLIHTMGELCLSPVGLSMVTKLAPPTVTGMIMGAWFISIAIGNFLAGRFSEYAAKLVEAAKPEGALAMANAYGTAFNQLLYITVGIGLGLVILSKLVNKLMHGVK